MMQQDHQTNAQTSSGEPPKDLEQLLREINTQITDYESKKLQQIKRELEAFVSTKKAVFEDYKTKHPMLKDKWYKQNSDVTAIAQHLACIFKKETRDQHIENCICSKRKEIDKASTEIETRKARGKGKNETRRDEAKAIYDAAKADLEALKANAQRLEIELTTNQKTIAEIQALLQGPDRAVAIWLFWFTLLPSHRQLMPNPKSLPKDCTVAGEGESPADLCNPKAEEKPAGGDIPAEPGQSAPDPGKASPAQVAQAAQPASTSTPGRTAPWLIDPGAYEKALDAAWTRYKEAQEALGKAEAAYAAAPDDLAASARKLEDLRKALDGAVRDCLKKLTPTDPCCPPTTN